MAENRLHGRFAHTPAHKFGRQAVPEGVGRHVTFNTRAARGLGHDKFDGAWIDCVARLTRFIPAAERGIGARAPAIIQAGTSVGRERLRGMIIEVYGAALATFGAIDKCGLLRQVDIAPAQRAKFGDPHACTMQR
jgi:hypothetical protein